MRKGDFEENSSLTHKYWIKHEGIFFFIHTLRISIDILYTSRKNKFL